jgi:CTP synthase
VLQWPTANSREFSSEDKLVIDLMEDQHNQTDKGGSMRLGAYDCHLVTDSLAYQAYQTSVVSERHRHRYEFNNTYREAFESAGLRIVGENRDRNLVEIIEIPDHPWYLACQFHPEFKSRPNRPHPLFSSFIQGVLSKQ